MPDFAGAGGALTIRSAGAADTVFVDTLRILIDRFCLAGLAGLLLEGRQIVSFFDHEETARLSITGAEVTLSGDQIETRTLPLDQYAASQKACGERYLAVARRLWPDGAAQPAWIATLEAELQG